MVNIVADFKTRAPILGDNPKVTILGDPSEKYYIRFIDKEKRTIVNEGHCTGGQTVVGNRQWYTDWLIEIFDMSGNRIKTLDFEPTFKKIFIKMDAYALGDNLAWMPYIEAFRKKHNCDIICSTFFNSFFIKAYPEILFVKPNTEIENVYAQFYVGSEDKNNLNYSPVLSSEVPLQSVASSILGLENKELIPSISFNQRPNNIEGKYVCLSEWASHEKKMWKYPNGWQSVVDYFNSIGYKVVVISKEPTKLTGVIDKTGDIDLNDRVNDLYYCEMFLGVSSGLSWLAWAVQKQVVMISDVTPKWHEFSTRNLRFCKNNLTKVDYSEQEATSSKEVLEGIRILMES
jgi:autotransporter strand-loop-strand O-heptosyltransferase